MFSVHDTHDTYEYAGNQYAVTCYLTPGDIPKVIFTGSMRLETAEEAPINEILARVVDEDSGEDQVIVDLHSLTFINSRGISMLYKLAINLRNKNVDMNIFAVKQSAWQQATLNNILKLSPNSTITWSEAAN
jgi:hypothetical protein